MKCSTCKVEFYPTTYDTFWDNGHKFRCYPCSWCGSDNMYEIPVNRHLNKAVFAERVSQIIVAISIFVATYYIFLHPEKFFTTF
jgi:hypothetical protein